MTTYHKLAFALLAFSAGASQACYVPPAAQRIGVAQQVRDAAPEAAPDYERIGRFLYGYQRLITAPDLSPEALAAEHAPDDLRRRAARLAAEYEHIVQDHFSAPQAQLDAVLREAAALQAALAAWRSGAGQ
jgi:hypothetical protein